MLRVLTDSRLASSFFLMMVGWTGPEVPTASMGSLEDIVLTLVVLIVTFMVTQGWPCQRFVGY